MSEFQKGQLVAVRDYDEAEWKLRVYDHERDGRHYCRLIDGLGTIGGVGWNQVVPADVVWPDIFLGNERDIIDAQQQSLDWETRKNKRLCEIAKRMHKRLSWLCERLQTLGECPPDGCFRDCRFGCAACWEKSSLEFIKDAEHE